MKHPYFYHTSWVTKTQICYTVEALHYAQAAFLISIVTVQWADLIITKTRALSLGQQGMTNWHANASLLFETCLVIVFSYLPWLNLVFGTRMIAFPHFMIPALSWFCIMFFYDEMRKLYIRRGMRKDRKANKTVYDGWIARNTYY
jgi:sodium/potassium-transporting ATPase subunit alpha